AGAGGLPGLAGRAAAARGTGRQPPRCPAAGERAAGAPVTGAGPAAGRARPSRGRREAAAGPARAARRAGARPAGPDGRGKGPWGRPVTRASDGRRQSRRPAPAWAATFAATDGAGSILVYRVGVQPASVPRSGSFAAL